MDELNKLDNSNDNKIHNLRDLRWTESALDCYKRGGRCLGCTVYEILGKTCRMKKTIIEITLKIGAPPKKEWLLPGMTLCEYELVKAILNGKNTKEEIAKYLKITQAALQQRVRKLYSLAQENGMSAKKSCANIQELIQFFNNLKPDKENPLVQEEEIISDNELGFKYPKSLEPLIKAIKAGIYTYFHLEKHTGIKRNILSQQFLILWTILKNHSLVSENITVSKRQMVINFIRQKSFVASNT